MKHHQTITNNKKEGRTKTNKGQNHIKPVMMHLTKDVINEVYSFYIDQWKSGEYP